MIAKHWCGGAIQFGIEGVVNYNRKNENEIQKEKEKERYSG